MGAFSENPEHFLTWTQERGERADRSDFLPCRLFRDYIVDLIREARQARTNGQLFEHVCGEVIDIEAEGGCATIHVEAQEPFVVDPTAFPQAREMITTLAEGFIRGPLGLQ